MLLCIGTRTRTEMGFISVDLGRHTRGCSSVHSTLIIVIIVVVVGKPPPRNDVHPGVRGASPLFSESTTGLEPTRLNPDEGTGSSDHAVSVDTLPRRNDQTLPTYRRIAIYSYIIFIYENSNVLENYTIIRLRSRHI